MPELKFKAIKKKKIKFETKLKAHFSELGFQINV